MFKTIQAALEDQKVLLTAALNKVREWQPENDPQISAKGKSVSFLSGKLAEVTRDIDEYRIAQLCLDNMDPVVTPAGAASPVPAPAPEPDDYDG